MTANAKAITYKSAVGILVTVVGILIGAVVNNFNKELDKKADKENVMLQLNYISQTVSDIKVALEKLEREKRK